MREFISMTPQNDRTPVHCEQWQAEDADAAWKLIEAKLIPFLEEELETSGTDWWYVECDVQLHEVYHYEDEDGDPDCEEEHLWTGTVTGYRCIHCDRCNKPHLPGKDGYSDCDHYHDRCSEHMDRWINECDCWRAAEEMAYRRETRGERKRTAKIWRKIERKERRKLRRAA